MIMNYIKTAVRILFKNKVNSSINIIGLSLGMTATLLILFIDTEFDALYKNERKASILILLFSVVSIFTSLLGLLGLDILMLEEKAKEIGVRKFLGASIFSICAMISKEFLLLVSLAFIIATPMAYFIMGKWIQEFAYHIGNEWQLYLLAGIVTLFLVLLTVCSITIRNFRGNLARRLRHE